MPVFTGFCERNKQPGIWKQTMRSNNKRQPYFILRLCENSRSTSCTSRTPKMTLISPQTPPPQTLSPLQRRRGEERRGEERRGDISISGTPPKSCGDPPGGPDPQVENHWRMPCSDLTFIKEPRSDLHHEPTQSARPVCVCVGRRPTHTHTLSLH